MSQDPIFEALHKIVRDIEAGPPRLDRVYATHKVPYGRMYRMWTSDGRMIAYMNRGEIADIPRAPAALGLTVLPPGLFGIPIVNE